MCVTPSRIMVDRGDHWEEVPVPCKQCWRCRENRINDYVGRALCEASVSDWTLSLTLTYAPRDDLAERVLRRLHAQQFLRSLRDRRHRIRYLIAGEYGERKGRSHFHVILFGMGKRPGFYLERDHWRFGEKHFPKQELPSERQRVWMDEWPHGHVFGSYNADHRTLRYPCKYLQKAEDTQSWFSMSKKPPLGWDWFARKAEMAIAAGVMPSSWEYFPPGGIPGKPYLMTGATRRDYLDLVTRGLRATRDIDPTTCSVWVQKSIQKLFRDQDKKAGKRCWFRDFIALNDELKARRPRADDGPLYDFRLVSLLDGETFEDQPLCRSIRAHQKELDRLRADRLWIDQVNQDLEETTWHEDGRTVHGRVSGADQLDAQIRHLARRLRLLSDRKAHVLRQLDLEPESRAKRSQAHARMKLYPERCPTWAPWETNRLRRIDGRSNVKRLRSRSFHSIPNGSAKPAPGERAATERRGRSFPGASD